jgi:hypothetical protein
MRRALLSDALLDDDAKDIGVTEEATEEETEEAMCELIAAEATLATEALVEEALPPLPPPQAVIKMPPSNGASICKHRLGIVFLLRIILITSFMFNAYYNAATHQRLTRRVNIIYSPLPNIVNRGATRQTKANENLHSPLFFYCRFKLFFRLVFF